MFFLFFILINNDIQHSLLITEGIYTTSSTKPPQKKLSLCLWVGGQSHVTYSFLSLAMLSVIGMQCCISQYFRGFFLFVFFWFFWCGWYYKHAFLCPCFSTALHKKNSFAVLVSYCYFTVLVFYRTMYLQQEN